MKQATILSVSLIAFGLMSCKKDWLDAKPIKSLVVPKSVQDYQALLDNTLNLFNIQEPGLQEVSADDIYMDSAFWSGRTQIERNTYIWASDIYQGAKSNTDWLYAYNRILNANVTLEGIQKIPINSSSLESWNNVKGSALFYRSYDFYSLAQLFCKPYQNRTSKSDLGVPLKLSSNVSEKIRRPSLQETYDQTINDLKLAKDLLPNVPPTLYKTRPSKAAVYGLLARIYLSMSDYSNALAFADSCLQLSNTLIDYNTLNKGADQPFSRFNDEVIFHANMLLYRSAYKGQVDTSLTNMYSKNDLRKPMFIRSNFSFKGTYDGHYNLFCGLAVDEMYLVRAECRARKGDITSAMNDLNALLVKRWSTGTFTPYSALNADDVLSIILTERRKELVFRGLRWTDLRRLNIDPKFAKGLTRNLGGQIYTLAPNDSKYVFPIPIDEITQSGIIQNPR